MEEIKALLEQVLANQVVIFKRLESIENKMKKTHRSAPDKTYVDELKKEAEKYMQYFGAIPKMQ